MSDDRREPVSRASGELDLARLSALIDAATPGPWMTHPGMRDDITDGAEPPAVSHEATPKAEQANSGGGAELPEAES